MTHVVQVKVLSQMKHPNIVSYLESFESGSIPFLLHMYTLLTMTYLSSTRCRKPVHCDGLL